ncbi:unnamed protein product [Microthlaspi erraticum]|uniref:Major facilitator superfamily (MFS) profile domain-containing protein n=1 Tax=Microthlaspi erraticum TaxID=1685480 RepID=A0A6D2LAZ1_9BRAS|nr:unnamed protein product [Microthlaspi erraticum]
MSLPGIAYLVRHASWRVLYLCTSVPAVHPQYCPLFLRLGVSSLASSARKNEEAIQVLKKISPAKRVTWNQYLISYLEKKPSNKLQARSRTCSAEDGLSKNRSCYDHNVWVGDDVLRSSISELGSFFCARIGFNLMSVYLVEMFPTCVRNFATTMLRQALVLGGACCPSLLQLEEMFRRFSFAVFGTALAGLGLFVLLLPETKGSSLCDTSKHKSRETKP